MQALHERGTQRTAVDRESLSEIWQTNALRASRPMLTACLALGVPGAAGLAALFAVLNLLAFAFGGSVGVMRG